MAGRIQKLTSEQEALIPVVRDEWLSLGLKSSPAERKAAEEGAAAAYRAAGLEPPRVVIWLDSPLAGAIGIMYLQRLLGALQAGGGQVEDQVWDQVWDQVRDQVWGQVWDQVWGQVRGQVWDQVEGAGSGPGRVQELL